MTARHERMKTTGLSGLRQHAWLLQQTTLGGTKKSLHGRELQDTVSRQQYLTWTDAVLIYADQISTRGTSKD